MLRADLIEQLAGAYPHLGRRVINRAVDVFFGRISRVMSGGGRVELRGFGAFSTRSRKAHLGRNPRNGEPVSVSDKRVPFFRPAKVLRRTLAPSLNQLPESGHKNEPRSGAASND